MKTQNESYEATFDSLFIDGTVSAFDYTIKQKYPMTNDLDGLYCNTISGHIQFDRLSCPGNEKHRINFDIAINVGRYSLFQFKDMYIVDSTYQPLTIGDIKINEKYFYFAKLKEPIERL